MKHILATVALVALSLGLVPSAMAQDATTTTADGKLLLLLDSSGSMKESAGGQTKIAAAKAALKDVVAKLPDDAQVGVRVFGAKVFSAKDKGACTDTQNVVPVGPLDRQGITDAVAGYKPYGETPIGNALKGAAKDLGSEGKRTIVLLSDGEPTCSPDPCKVAKDLRAQGVDLTVNVVGLNVSGKARSALQCIADAGGGTYYGVDEPEELASSLVTTSVRAFREFGLQGKPVEGGTSTANALAIEPGQYTDTTPGGKASLYYLVDKPANGSVAVSMTARPKASEQDRLLESATVQLMTKDGMECELSINQRANYRGLSPLITTVAHYSPLSTDSTPECEAAGQLVAAVEYPREDRVPFELGVTAFAEITNATGLPAAINDRSEIEPKQLPVAAGTGATDVVGGSSFNDAPTLKTGTYHDTLRPSEQLIYRVPVEWGQSPRVTVRIQTDAQADEAFGLLPPDVAIKAYSPLRAQLTYTENSDTNVDDNANYFGDKVATITSAPGEVRARNISSPDEDMRPMSLAGDHYFTVELAGLDDDESDFAAPIEISVAVDGKITGVPKFASPPKGLSTEKSTKDNGGGLPWLPIGIGAGVVALLGAGFALGRRNRTPA